jgi:HPt (histidine-containing phosphotransfer) domain-containing protein
MKDLRSRGAPDGPGICDKLIGLFLADTPLQFAKLREAAIRGDAADLERIAHRLRGSSASIGATRLLSHATDVETRARRGDVAAAVAAVEAFEDAWSITRAALEHVRRAPS